MRNLVLALSFCAQAANAFGQSATAPSEVAQKGRRFLADLFDSDLSLLPEYQGATVYWLFHDNYLAAKVLDSSHPELARKIRSAIEREGVRKSGKIEMLFGEAENPLPFHQYQLADVRRLGEKLIRTEIVTAAKLSDWESYADLLLLASIVQPDRSAARQNWDNAMQLWDGKGFHDAATKHSHRYSTYKLGLALIAAARFSPPVKVPDEVLPRLLSLQADSGGWITDYDANGNALGVANVETTCISILGIEALDRAGARVGN